MMANMNLLHVLLFAIVQGVTELFPISSLGHGVLLAHWLGWGSDLKSTSLLPFLTALHLGTATELLLYFWKDWFSFLQPQKIHPLFQKKNSVVLGYLVLGTIPAGILGLLLEKKLTLIFSNPFWVAIFLILNGGVLIFGEWLRRRGHTKKLESLGPIQVLEIGTAQVVALLPGFSRSGATQVGGLLMGLTHEPAAQCSFLLATRIIVAAA